MSTTKRARRHARPTGLKGKDGSEMDLIEALLCGPANWTDAENARIEAALELSEMLEHLAAWRRERAELKDKPAAVWPPKSEKAIRTKGELR